MRKRVVIVWKNKGSQFVWHITTENVRNFRCVCVFCQRFFVPESCWEKEFFEKCLTVHAILEGSLWKFKHNRFLFRYNRLGPPTAHKNSVMMCRMRKVPVSERPWLTRNPKDKINGAGFELYCDLTMRSHVVLMISARMLKQLFIKNSDFWFTWDMSV